MNNGCKLPNCFPASMDKIYETFNDPMTDGCPNIPGFPAPMTRLPGQNNNLCYNVFSIATPLENNTCPFDKVLLIDPTVKLCIDKPVKPNSGLGSDPPTVANPAPPTVASPTPLTVASPTPLTVASPTPLTVANPAPLTVTNPAPPTVASPTPLTVANPAQTSISSAGANPTQEKKDLDDSTGASSAQLIPGIDNKMLMIGAGIFMIVLVVLIM